jgi:hypothetical protein
LSERGKGGEEAMNQGKKPEPFKRKTIRLKGLVFVKKKADQPRFSGLIPYQTRRLPNVKPRREVKGGEEAVHQKKPEIERREDRKRINEELEFLIEMEDRAPRKDEKKPVDYDLEQLVEETVDNAMAELRRALPPEELEIYEKCYRFFKRTNSRVIRDYTAEQILRKVPHIEGVRSDESSSMEREEGNESEGAEQLQEVTTRVPIADLHRRRHSSS